MTNTFTHAVWPLKPLRRLVTIRSSNVDKIMEEGEETVRLCNYVDVYYNDRITGDIAFSDGSAKPREIAKFALRAGDVIITKDSETPDDIAIPALVEPSAEGVVCGYHLAILRPRPSEILGPFLFWTLMAKPTREAFGNAAQGVTRYGLTLNGIGSVSIPVPDLDTQRAVSTFLDRETTRIDEMVRKVGGQESAEIAVKGSLLSLLVEHRAALITAAVAGQIDMRHNLPAVISTSDRDRFRIVVGAEIIHQHRSNPKFGRVKLQKELYLAEAHLGIGELQGNYVRQAAGPLDRALIEETERAVEAAGFYRASQADGAGKTVTYAPLSNAGRHKAELKNLLGPRVDALDVLIALLRDFGTEAVEAIATLYAVWNDALIDGQRPDDSVIVNGVLNEWHEEKGEKFKDSDLLHWLDWMKRNGLTPRGQGPRTVQTITRDMFA